MSIRDLFAEPDPFVGDVVLPNGNSKSAELSKPLPKSKGFQKFDRPAKSLLDQMADVEQYGLPEDGAGKKKRRKKVSHKDRAIKYLMALGYSVTWVERFVVTKDGYGFHQDFRGMWDARCYRQGEPELRVNVCGGQADRAAHIRKFCKDKTIKRFREDLTDPKVVCALLGFDKQPNGRYEPTFQRLTIRDLEACLSRRRNVA